VNTSSSVYAKPVAPRIVLRPALASVCLHALLLFMLTANWADSNREIIRVKPAPKVINARLVDASEFKPKPKAAPPKPAAKPAPKPVPKPTPKPAPPSPNPRRCRNRHPSPRPSLRPNQLLPNPSRHRPRRNRSNPA